MASRQFARLLDRRPQVGRSRAQGMILRLETPEHAGARDQARDLVDQLDPELSGDEVLLDCDRLLVGTPSFLDEIVKQVLAQRGTSSLLVHGASERVQQLLERSAENRGLRDRLTFAVRS